MVNVFFHSPLGIALGLLLVLLIFAVFVCDDEDDFVDFFIKVTLNPVGYIVDFFSAILKIGAVALFIYLLIEHTWWVVGSIIVVVAFSIIVSDYTGHNEEMRIYESVLKLMQKGNYEIAENILNQKAKDMGDKEVGELHSSLINLISSLKKKEGKRKPKVWNIHIYDPIQPNKALVPMSHYQMETNEK